MARKIVFEDHLVQSESGCIEWSGYRRSDGYGVCGSLLAHRVAWAKRNGPIPHGLFILHKCNNRACCNADHLYAGTHQDNMNDMKRSGVRVGATRGSKSPLALLSEADIPKIRERIRAGETYLSIGADYGVTQDCIRNIKRGSTWSFVE